MSEWTKQRLEQMIADGVEESLSLDYKRANSLSKTDDKKKTEVTKDISSFANSSGGALIYGVAEFNDDPRKHLPERLDPILRTEISKEWLDQVIQSIQPRIEGVVIHPVTISEPDSTVCYVVKVPQSHTAHMARDHRYHKRVNFTTAQMEDYEVRDVMSRRTQPKISVSLRINKQTERIKPEGLILVKLENHGNTLVRDMMVELEVPFHLAGVGLIGIEKPVIHNSDADGDFYVVRMTPGFPSPPLFPSSDKTLRRKMFTHIQARRVDGQPIKPRPFINVRVFADEMRPMQAKLDIAPVLLGWTPIQNAEV